MSHVVLQAVPNAVASGDGGAELWTWLTRNDAATEGAALAATLVVDLMVMVLRRRFRH